MSTTDPIAPVALPGSDPDRLGSSCHVSARASPGETATATVRCSAIFFDASAEQGEVLPGSPTCSPPRSPPAS